ncbi:ATP-binding protein [Mycobacterium sp. 360MFTsu5.1]|uniref:ATP-binding protein n=1 Tax=Mycobacterium sp. 360MFTsu5.1 TaxID=1172186 RepID=UPI0003A09ADF|nr:ATP-binding protein [Mycobacterium sp. 360MFTsu5.1]
MGITPDLNALLERLRDVAVTDDMSRDDAVAAMTCVMKLRNVIDHLAAMLTGALDRRGVAAAQGQTPRELLVTLGCAPSVAERFIRVSGALPALPTLAAHAADGAISGEHVDAIVKGINHIRARAPGEVDEEARFAQVTDLLGQFFSGATPTDIDKRARRLGNRVAAAEGGLPAAEDRSINTADHRVTSDGRVQIRADLDAEVGAKYIAAIEQGSAPRPEPDGSPDVRSASRRRADALEAVLDIAARGGDVASSPRTQLLITVPAEAPDLATLEFIGSISTRDPVGPEHRWALDLPDHPVIAVGDRPRLQQVLTNLLSNARVHTPAGTTVVTALTDTADGAISLTVSDNGPGIPADVLPDIFERFARGDESRSRAAGSTGLGLAIAQAVAKAHRGTIAVDSSPNGSAFTVMLPARDA